MSSSTHRFVRSFQAMATALGVIVALSLPSSAQSPSISLSRHSGHPTKQVTVTGSAFGTWETVQVEFDAAAVASPSTDAAGAFEATFDVPATALPGPHQVTATGQTSGMSAQAAFRVRTNWRTFRFNSAHTGYNAYENVLRPSNVAGLQLKWKNRRPDRVQYSSPSVVNGIAYVGSWWGSLYAIRATTGRVEWSFATGEVIIRSSPAVANGSVYIGSDKLYALDASTGSLKWSFASGAYFHSTPVVANGVVYAGSGEGNVYALNASTGALEWSYTTAPYNESTPAVANGVVYVGSEEATSTR